jgi:hypothetical protein
MEIRIGDTISYTLRLDQRPTNPSREHTAIVNYVISENYVMVTLLDKEYEGLTEYVAMSQIREVRRGVMQ